MDNTLDIGKMILGQSSLPQKPTWTLPQINKTPAQVISSSIPQPTQPQKPVVNQQSTNTLPASTQTTSQSTLPSQTSAQTQSTYIGLNGQPTAKPGDLFSPEEESIIKLLYSSGDKVNQRKAIDLYSNRIDQGKQLKYQSDLLKYNNNVATQGTKNSILNDNLQNKDYQNYYNTNIKPYLNQATIDSAYKGSSTPPPTLPTYSGNNNSNSTSNGSGSSNLSSEDLQALQWANENPNDPRAAKIIELHSQK
jgi:hypothetical protein